VPKQPGSPLYIRFGIDAGEPYSLKPFTFQRRDLRPNDVSIDILYCGVCHSDLHTARGDWDGLIHPNGTAYPCVPGHEILGGVTAVGNTVTKFKEGDLAGLGCMVERCLHCEACGKGLEQHCEHFPTWTYNSPDRTTDENTHRGYSDSIVVRQEFVLHVRHQEKDLAAVATGVCRWRIHGAQGKPEASGRGCAWCLH
jgi:alcohol dehydrogenase (NADP+)